MFEGLFSVYQLYFKCLFIENILALTIHFYLQVYLFQHSISVYFVILLFIGTTVPGFLFPKETVQFCRIAASGRHFWINELIFYPKQFWWLCSGETNDATLRLTFHMATIRLTIHCVCSARQTMLLSVLNCLVRNTSCIFIDTSDEQCIPE